MNSGVLPPKFDKWSGTIDGGMAVFGEDENHAYDREERKNPYSQWQEKQAQRRRTRRADRGKVPKNA